MLHSSDLFDKTHRKMQNGNLVSWSSAEFENERMDELDMSEEEICHPIRPGHVIMPNQRNFSSFSALCKKFGGQTSVVRDLETQHKLTNIIFNYDACMMNAGEILTIFL